MDCAGHALGQRVSVAPCSLALSQAHAQSWRWLLLQLHTEAGPDLNGSMRGEMGGSGGGAGVLAGRQRVCVCVLCRGVQLCSALSCTSPPHLLTFSSLSLPSTALSTSRASSSSCP